MLNQTTSDLRISQGVIGGWALGIARPNPAERRQHPRYPFKGTFEAIEPNSETRIQGRTADLSEGGCYADTMSPLPAGTAVKVRINKGNRSFESQATVAYAVSGMGMGLRFESIDPRQLASLRRWLEEVRGESLADVEADKGEERVCAGPQSKDVLNQLIGELMRKGILNDSMGKEMLQRLA